VAIGVCAFVSAVCAEEPTRPASDNNVGWQVIEFPQRTLTLKPTRDDITVGCVNLVQKLLGKMFGVRFVDSGSIK
jgi:hypothetical protein